MEEENRELLRRLFVLATEVLEAAQDEAVEGQSPWLEAAGYAACAETLAAAAEDLARVAAVIRIAAEGRRPPQSPTP